MSALEEMLASLRDMAASRGSDNMPWDATPADTAGPDFKDRFGGMAAPSGAAAPFGAGFQTSQPMEKYTDYSQGWPQEMTRPKAQFGDIPQPAPAGPPQMPAQAPLPGLQGTIGATAPFSLAGPQGPAMPPSMVAAAQMTAQPPVQPGGGLPPGPGAPGAAPQPAAPPAEGDDEGSDTPPAKPGPGAPPAPAAAPMGIAGPPADAAAAAADEPSFLDKIKSGAKGIAPALLGMGAALQGDQGHMTAALVSQQQALAEQQQTQNLTAKALIAKGVDPATVQAAIREPALLKAIIGEQFGKSKYKVQVVGEDQFGGKTYAAVNENDPTDVKTFVPGKGFISAKPGDSGAGGDGEGASGGPGGYFSPGVKELDPAKTGDEYLTQFSPEAQAAVKSYINGDSQPTSNPRKGWAENIKKIAQKYGGDMGIPVNDQLFYQKKNFLNSLGNTNSGVGMQVKGFQQGLHHLGSAADSLEKMGNWGGFGFGPLAEWENRARQLGTGQAGQAAKAAGEIQALAGETGKLFSGSAGGGVGERAETRARFDTRKSPTEIAGALEGQLELMMGGLQSLEQRRDDIFGPNGKDVRGANFMGPKEQAEVARVRGIIDRLRGGAATEPSHGAAAGPPKPGKYMWTPDKGLVAAP